MKVLGSDRGGEYDSHGCKKSCEDIVMKRQLTIKYTPQKSGASGRKKGTIVEMKKSMLYE